jgi:hypothetical protein
VVSPQEADSLARAFGEVLAARASEFPWSSAAAHTGVVLPPEWLQPDPISSAFTPEQWAAYLESDRISEEEMELRRIRTRDGRRVRAHS